jgi:large subunit ribosomal protein L13
MPLALYIIKQKLGHIVPQITRVLMGKDRPDYQSHYCSSPDKAVVVNASNIKVTRNKLKVIKYYSYTGYPHGLKIKELGEYMKKNPIKCMQTIVKKQLPKNNIMPDYLNKLIVFPGPYHNLHEIGIPQFMQRTEEDPNESSYLKITPQTHELISSSTNENPPEFKDVPIQLDHSIDAGRSGVIQTMRPHYGRIINYRKKVARFEKRKAKQNRGI